MTQYKLTTAPIDGLSVQASYYSFGEMGAGDNRQEAEGGSLSANYSLGQFSVGYGETRHAPAQAMNGAVATDKTDYYENQGYSIGFAVNDNLSVSFTEETSEKNVKKKAALSNTITRSDVEMEIQTIDIAYTVGGATFSVSTSDATNDSYTTGDDSSEHIFAMSLAF